MLKAWLEQVRDVVASESDTSDDRGLRFYRAASRRRRMHFLHAIFPRSLRIPAVHERVLSGPLGGDRDWNRNAAVALLVVEELVASGDLPPQALEGAEHEWRAFTTGLGAIPEGTGVNPSLEVVRCTRDWSRWRPPGWPEPLECHFAYWIHPTTLRSRWVRLTPRHLLPLKVVSEGLPLVSVAGETGWTVDEVRKSLEMSVDMGMVMSTAPVSPGTLPPEDACGS